MMQAVKFWHFGTEKDLKEYGYGDWCIVKYVDKKETFYVWWITDEDIIDFYDNRKFSSYDDAFRAARKWMRDHQNEIFG